MSKVISKNPGRLLQAKVKRDGMIVSIEIEPNAAEAEDIFGKKRTIGRIGIVAHATPAVVAVLREDSPAAAAGLRTGDRIVEAEVDGQWREVKFYRLFIKTISNAIERGESALSIRYQDTRGISHQTILKFEDIASRQVAEHQDRLAEDLGLVLPQLVVGKVAKSALGVLQQRDRILAWDEQPVVSKIDLALAADKNERSSVSMKIQRGFDVLDLQVNQLEREWQLPEGKKTYYHPPVEAYLGDPVQMPSYVERYENFFSAMVYGVKETAIRATFLVESVARLVTGDVPLKALGGPLMIANLASEAAKSGLRNYLNMMALISVNLAVLNLIPIPALDGGQLVMFSIEGIRRRRMSEIAIENFQKVGFVMIMALVVLAVYNDLSRFWTSMLKSVVGMFQ